MWLNSPGACGKHGRYRCGECDCPPGHTTDAAVAAARAEERQACAKEAEHVAICLELGVMVHFEGDDAARQKAIRLDAGAKAARRIAQRIRERGATVR